MSSSPPQPPDFDRVEKGVNLFTSLPSKLSTFVRDVAGWIRKRQWLELLMLIVAITILILLSKAAINHYFKNVSPYFYYIWSAIGLIFVIAVIIELRKKPPLKFVSRDVGKRKAIKFLSSFEQEDAEIFARLQGYRDLGVISENITRPDFSFGILKGKSGCGKSSYLKAGLLAELAKTETHRGVYIKFSNLDPLETIREAFIDSLKLPKAEIETLNFLELLNKGIEVASQSCQNFKSLILIFDQFEQFFVYTDDQARREAFIQDLAIWYNNNELTDKIKILVSIREDWFARMDEIQQSLNYTLRIGSQAGGNSFYLKNFSAEEATMILAVMAKEDLDIEENDVERFDSRYIQEILEQDLASPTDRLISPVDLQIIAETIKQQNTSEMRSFNRKALQKLGGIEGLRRSFLENILEDLGAERKKSAIQVLVSLTNLEQQTRVEVQTLAQLQDKVKSVVPPDEVENLVTYLQGTGLISVVERDGIKGSELAHEGMIAAVIQSGEQIQDKAYLANQLLERRVNEWLGNNRSSRYLFNLKELWSIKQQKFYLIWGSTRQEKQKLLEQSKRRIYWILGGFWGVLLIIIGTWSWLNYTTLGQLTQIRWKLVSVSRQISNSEYQLKAVGAFAKDENFEQASQLTDQIKDSFYKANALSMIAEVYSKLKQPEKAAPLLEQALNSANQIEDSDDKYSALIAIAEAINKLRQPEKAAPLLEKALNSANQMEDSSDKADAFRAIAEAINKLRQPEKAAPLLEKALNSANQMEDSDDKADVLSAIAEAINKLRQPEKAAPLLEKALNSANQMEDSDDKADVLSAIAEAINKLRQPEKTAPLLEKVLNSTNQMKDSDDKADVLSAIAEAINKLRQPEKTAPLLEKVLNSTNQVEDSSLKVDAISAIAEAISKFQQPEKATPLLEQALNSANQIEDSYLKIDAISAVAEAQANLKNWGQALKVAQQCPSKDCEVDSLAKILTVHAEQQHPELKQSEDLWKYLF
jgi:HEAT repeat protein